MCDSKDSSTTPSGALKRSALICHAGDELNEVGLFHWLSSFSHVVIIVRINEPISRKLRRVRREMTRIGVLRMIDVLLYRVAHNLLHRKQVREWTRSTIARCSQLSKLNVLPIILDVKNANDPAVEQAFKRLDLDFALARCKQILAPRVFEAPRAGTFVLHPGICPEYRNAHGGFWALAMNDEKNVGTTLLRIDRGVDTGPVFGYFKTEILPLHESALVIQDRTLFDNLGEIQQALIEAVEGHRPAIDVRGRPSREWGQPWFTAWMRYRRRLRGAA